VSATIRDHHNAWRDDFRRRWFSRQHHICWRCRHSICRGGAGSDPSFSGAPIVNSITSGSFIAALPSNSIAEIRATSGNGVGAEGVNITGGNNGALNIATMKLRRREASVRFGSGNNALIGVDSEYQFGTSNAAGTVVVSFAVNGALIGDFFVQAATSFASRERRKQLLLSSNA